MAMGKAGGRLPFVEKLRKILPICREVIAEPNLESYIIRLPVQVIHMRKSEQII